MSISRAAAAPYYISALLAPDWPHWGSNGAVLYDTTLGQAATVTYSFLTSSSGLAADDAAGFAPMSATQKAYVRQALTAWSSVANITFSETLSGSAAQIRFGTNRQNGVSAGYAYYPSTASTGGLTLLANDDSNNTSPSPGSYGYLTLIHEIGHAIGLKHPGDYNAGDNFTADGPFLPAAEDYYSYSVMSYNENSNLPATYQTQAAIYDIAAVQYLYGANTAAAPGNDTYTLTPSAFISIWDPNGTNTLDASAQSAAEVININGGGFTTIGGTLVAGVAFNSRIQVVRAGSGSDTIYANALGNTIDGGAGTDTVVFSGASSSYVTTNLAGTIVVSQNGVVNTLTNVERLRFDDATIQTSSIATSVANVTNGVYRFFNRSNGTHFYTSSTAERDYVINTLSTMSYEGVAFTSIASTTGGAAPVYRFFNRQVGSHFYTINAAERDNVINTLSNVYSYEGEAYSAYTSDSAGATAAGSSPLYRFFNRQTGSHFYTVSAGERDNVISTLSNIYSYEGVAYYVSSSTASSAAGPDSPSRAHQLFASADAVLGTALTTT
ncbi:matrixin family metalloprotease [Azospirillum sp.]|uniref:matrixin family metalloprotease n=1 Tax=Azospirillum sp. TaxID=34012 RepID=UPI003D70FC5C